MIFKGTLLLSAYDIQQYLGENGIVYTYNIGFEVYSYDEDGNIVRSDAETKDADTESSGGFGDLLSMRNEMMNAYKTNNVDLYEE